MIRIVLLIDVNISSRIKSTAEQYSMVRGMFTSRSTIVSKKRPVGSFLGA